MDRQRSTCREQRRDPIDRQRVDPACLVPRQTGMSGMICEGSTMMPPIHSNANNRHGHHRQDWAESKRARLVHTGFKSKKNVASNH